MNSEKKSMQSYIDKDDMNMLEKHHDMKRRIGEWSKELTDDQKTSIINDLVLYLTQINEIEFEPEFISPSWGANGEPIISGQQVGQDEIFWKPPAGLDRGLISEPHCSRCYIGMEKS